MFSVASDEIEIGKIQGRQLAALLSNGGHVLYLQGPHSSSISHLRLTGFNEAKPPNCNIRSLVSQWTRANASRSVDLWIWLSPIETRISVVVAQSNLIALGCRDALRKNPIYQGSRDLLFIGGGLTPIGSLTTDEEPLDATVHTPSTSGLAIDTLISALRTGTKTPELLSVLPESCETRRTEWQRTILPTDPEAHLQTPMHSFSEVSNES
jgi:ABC-type sugar transport system substrate-binding protein